MGVFDAVASAFGPFLIPAAIFALGIAFYVVLWWLGRRHQREPPQR